MNNLYIHVDCEEIEGLEKMIMSFNKYIEEMKIEKFYEIIFIGNNGAQHVIG